MTYLRYAALLLALPLPGQQFEVASIKVSNPPPDRRGSSSIGDGNGGFRTTNASLFQLILFALGAQSYQVSGGPGWVRDERYDIAAKNDTVEDETIPLTDVSRHEARTGRMRARVRNLLETRFQLVVREEQKELPVYSLTVEKGGIKVSPVSEPKGNINSNSNNGVGSIRGEGLTMPRLCLALSGILQRPVIDETGVAGAYDVELKYTMDNSAAAQDKALEEVTGPSIFTAVRETLGLRLSGKKAPVKTWVIERVEKPSEN